MKNQWSNLEQMQKIVLKSANTSNTSLWICSLDFIKDLKDLSKRNPAMIYFQKGVTVFSEPFLMQRFEN